MMQVVAAAAMEPPAGGDLAAFKDAMFAVFRAMPDADPAHYVRGQYDGYRSIEGVAADSTTETYAALRLEIENWRWSGVPFFLRTGKCLPVTQTELRVVFKDPPRLGFWSAREFQPEPSQMVIKLDPTTGIRLRVEAQRGDRPKPEEIHLDMEFAEEGGEAATPYEVLLHAAMVGQSARFTRQDSVQETWRILQPLLDAPPPVHPYAKGSWGPDAADQPGGRVRRLARPVGDVMSPAKGAKRARPATAALAGVEGFQSAAMPSPFSPIDEYAFLSNCHTGALVAADGAVDWLCVPRFDSPSVFGALLDREAGAFRLGPFGINVPSGRAYEPGTNTLVTTWKTPARLGRGPRRPDDGPAGGRGRGHAAHPAPGRRRRRPPAGADGPLPGGRGRGGAGLRAHLRLRPHPGRLGAGGREPAGRRRQRRRPDAAAADQHGAGDRGQPGQGPARPARGRAALVRAVVGRGPGRPRRRSTTPTVAWPRPRGSGAPGWDGPASPTTAGASRSSVPPWPSRASPTCRPGRRWRRSPPRCPRRRAGSATGTTATPGCATAPSPSRRCTGSTWTGRPTSSCSSSPTSSPTRTAPCRSCTGSTGAAT